MSEQEKKALESLAEAVNRVPTEHLNRVLGYVEGYADGMEAFRRREKEEAHAEG